MNLKTLRETQEKISTLVINRHLKDALQILEEMVAYTKNVDFRTHIENLQFTYQNVLKYSFELNDDPEREKIYLKLQREIIELSDKAGIYIEKANILTTFYNDKASEYSHINIKNHLRDKIRELELSDESNTGNEKTIAQSLHVFSDLFKQLWLSDSLVDTDMDLIRSIIHSTHIKAPFKAVIVSAITLSLFRFFDKSKINILLEFVEKRDETVWHRALTGLILALLLYDKRLFLYPEVLNRLISIQDDISIEKNIELILIQFIRAQDTERVTRKIREEIMPDMMKMQSKLTNKLNLDDITSLEELHEKNPEWQTAFEDSPDLFDKVGKITQMQIDGVDIFHSAFSQLKHFPFFNEMVNWFIPFFKQNPALNSFRDEAEAGTSDDFLDGLEKSGMMCNSDKYSFCFNVHMLPTEYRQQLVKLFQLELDAMNEVNESDKLVNNQAVNKFMFNQYLQDLYRFFKVYPKRREFNDVFNIDINFKQSFLVKRVFNDKKILRNIGEFYFENELYQQAIQVFKQLVDNSNAFELFEKIGYAYQKVNNYQLAIEYYEKAELLEDQNAWLYKKLGHCNRVLKQYNKALEHFKQAEIIEPENLYIQANLAGIHMEKSAFNEALKRYYKIEYLTPDNYAIMRPLAWCSLNMGDIETARKYLLKIDKNERTEHDLLYLGHTEWLNNNKQNAIGYYGLAIKKAREGYAWFKTEMQDDIAMLYKQGLNSLDIYLMIDYLAYQEL